MGNKGALIRLNGKELKPKFTKFTAVVRIILIILVTPRSRSNEVRESLDVFLKQWRSFTISVYKKYLNILTYI
jgi:hypothetical protein